MRLPEVMWRDGKPFHKKLPEMADIGVPDPGGNLAHRQVGLFQQYRRLIEPDLLDIFGKAHPRIILDQPDQMTFAVMEKIRHFLQAGILIMTFHVFQQKYKIWFVIFTGRVGDENILLMIAEQNRKEQLGNLIFLYGCHFTCCSVCCEIAIL